MIFILGLLSGIIISSIVIGFYIISPENIKIIQALGSIGILISASIALISYLSTVNKNKEERIKTKSQHNLDLALDFLKHSFEVLSNNDEKTIPENDRIIWLTSARQILKAQEIAKTIELDEHKKIYKEYEEFWRTKFYMYLERFKSDMNVRYFAENKELALGTWEGQKSPLAEKSLAVIFRFIEWDSERIDLIKDITDFTEEEIEKHETFKFRGLAEHIKEFKDYKKEKGIIN